MRNQTVWHFPGYLSVLHHHCNGRHGQSDAGKMPWGWSFIHLSNCNNECISTCTIISMSLWHLVSFSFLLLLFRLTISLTAALIVTVRNTCPQTWQMVCVAFLSSFLRFSFFISFLCSPHSFVICLYRLFNTLESFFFPGKITGKCITEATQCEILGWCPPENDKQAM